MIGEFKNIMDSKIENIENLTNINGINNPMTEYSTGAVRDIQETKGRCDLMPLAVISSLYRLNNSLYKEHIALSFDVFKCFSLIDTFIYTGTHDSLLSAVLIFIYNNKIWTSATAEECLGNALLDVSKHYKSGAVKYTERNWEKGIPLHSYIDSATRHLIKHLAGYKDERHDLAFIWNMLNCVHTAKYINNKDLMDLPGYSTLKTNHTYCEHTENIGEKTNECT